MKNSAGLALTQHGFVDVVIEVAAAVTSHVSSYGESDHVNPTECNIKT